MTSWDPFSEALGAGRMGTVDPRLDVPEDPTVGAGRRGQVDPAFRRGIYRRAPLEALERWHAAGFGEGKAMIAEELELRAGTFQLETCHGVV